MDVRPGGHEGEALHRAPRLEISFAKGERAGFLFQSESLPCPFCGIFVCEGVDARLVGAGEESPRGVPRLFQR